MRPTSRVIQLTPFYNYNNALCYFVVLCEDGSIWKYKTYENANPEWSLLSEMENGKYIC